MVLTHSVAKFYLLQIVQLTSEFTLRVFESATNMFSPVAHDDDGDSMKNKFPLLYSFKLAICYASCNEYFTKSGSFDVIMILCCDTTS